MKLTINSRHDESNLRSIGSASEMGVDLFCLVLVETDESVQDVVTCESVIISTFIVWEVVLHRTDGKLLLESIDLVQEQDNWRLDKPSWIANRVEKCKRFLHTVDSFIFEKQLIVLGDSDQEEDCRDILKAMDPLLSLGTLSSNIEHAVGKVSNDEGGFGDTRGLDTGAKDILIIWHVIMLSDSFDVIKVARQRVLGSALFIKKSSTGIQNLSTIKYLLSSRVVQLIFSWSLETILNTSILP